MLTMWGDILESLWDGVAQVAPQAVPVLLVAVLVWLPMPGRGPGVLSRRDWSSVFSPSVKLHIFDRAGGRCEAAGLVVWGRCRGAAQEADHVYPWSKSGPSVVSNGQALCAKHYRRKFDLTPPWWYVWGLEHRRLDYFPTGVDVRVLPPVEDDSEVARCNA